MEVAEGGGRGQTGTLRQMTGAGARGGGWIEGTDRHTQTETETSRARKTRRARNRNTISSVAVCKVCSMCPMKKHLPSITKLRHRANAVPPYNHA